MNQQSGQASFVEVSVTVDKSVVEPFCDYVIENFSSGLVLEDEEDTDETTVKFYLPVAGKDNYTEPITDRLAQLLECDQSKTPEIKSRVLTNIDWEEQYRNSVEMIVVEPGIIIRPPWHEPVLDAAYDVIIEPKMAFGTGRHETTRSCLRIIAERMTPGHRFLDLGCGSGILSILADKKGARYVKAIDYDPMAVENCRENFELNAVSSDNDILLGSIEQCDSDEPYQFICVNIIKETIIEMLPRLKELTTPEGVLVLAGLLAKDEPDVNARLSECGLSIRETVPDNEWLTFIVSREE